MNALFAAAAELQAFCSARGWRSTVIGGLAVQRWGEPRQTRDVDAAVLTELREEAPVVDGLLEQFRPRIPDARVFALDHRVLLVEAANGVPLDISLAALPYEGRLLDRSSPFPVSQDVAITTCSAEDLVVLKAVADRPQDWIDVEGIIVRQGARLNRDLVSRELAPLLGLKGDVEPAALLRRLFEKHHD